MGRLSPRPSWARRLRTSLVTGAPLVAISPPMHGTGRRTGLVHAVVRGTAPVVNTDSRGTGALHMAALHALQVIGRVDAAVQDGGEGVVTGTARVRYRDARRGRIGRQADPVRFGSALRAGRHGAHALALRASGRTPTAADWTPVEFGGITRVARQARTP